MSRVFVGDLASSETDASLRKRMSEYGEVVEAVVCKDKDKPKGYGFCVFSDETSAELCVTVEKQAGQRVWRVRPACALSWPAPFGLPCGWPALRVPLWL
jgi:hypothetical protein